MNIEGLINNVNKLAYSSAESGNAPFAALLVKNDQIVTSSIDLSIEKNDPTAHAEIELIRQYCTKNKIFSLHGYTLVSSTEPCVMCAGAIHWSRISKVIFSVSQHKLNQISNGKLKPSCSSIVNIGRQKVEVIGPILENEGIKVFKDFPLISKEERLLNKRIK